MDEFDLEENRQESEVAYYEIADSIIENVIDGLVEYEIDGLLHSNLQQQIIEIIKSFLTL